MKLGEKIFGAIFILVFLVLFYIVLDANKYSATVHVIEGQGKIGINPTTEVIDFGDLSPGTSAVRRIDFRNGTPVPVYVMVFRFGSITDLMKLDDNYFMLPARGQKRLEFSVYMPASAPVNTTMSGRVFIFKIPGPWGT